jgi:4-alpha-glucanotransferase
MTHARWGIEPSYRDAFGKRQEISEAVQRRLREAMGPGGGRLHHDAIEPVAVVRPGGQLPTPGEVTLEDGTQLGAVASLPPDAPYGYHHLAAAQGEQLLITGPGRCHLPAGLRTWAWNVQLYAARSRRSWGIGDLADLRELGAWSAGLGAGLMVLNPLSAPAPLVPLQASPYFPSSRRFRNPVYLRVEEVPGADAIGEQLPRLAAAGHALNGSRLLDRDAAFQLKMDALEAIWRARRPDDQLDAYRVEQGVALREWSSYAVIAEHHGPRWSRWPEELRRPGNAAVGRFAADHADRLAFHEWLQCLIDAQLARAGAELPLVQDMPIGVDRDGADAWAWQETMALDVNIGAPPDIFNPAGQDWGLPPFVPHRLRRAGYLPFIQTLRATLRHAGGLRIDHAMGLFRLWWLPLGEGATNGAYVRYPTDELLEILALESERARALIVGEDLGTVERGVRRELGRRRILSYRLVYFEQEPPSGYPRIALAGVTTHDLPTIAGTWSGSDLAMQERAGRPPDPSGLRKLRRRLERVSGEAPNAPVDDVILSVHRALGASPAMVVSATLEDALKVEERPNLPGTVDEHPNWRVPLPVPIEELMSDPFARRLAKALRRT